MAGAFNEFAPALATRRRICDGHRQLLPQGSRNDCISASKANLKPGHGQDVIFNASARRFEGDLSRGCNSTSRCGNLSMDDRMTDCQHGDRAGGKGIFEFDDQTRAFVDYRCKLNGRKPRTIRWNGLRRKSLFMNWSWTSRNSSRPSRAIPIPASANWPKS